MKRYRPWDPDQSFLFPPSPHDWLPEGHLAYFLLDAVSELDLSAIVKRIQAKDHRGGGRGPRGSGSGASGAGEAGARER